MRLSWNIFYIMFVFFVCDWNVGNPTKGTLQATEAQIRHDFRILFVTDLG